MKIGRGRKGVGGSGSRYATSAGNRIVPGLIAIALCAALSGASPASPPASSAAKKSCKLKGKGRTVYVNSKMRVIKRRIPDGGGFKLVACARGARKSRTLGVSEGRSDVTFRSAAATFVAVTRTMEDQLGYGEETLVIDVRSGRSYTVSSYSAQRDDPLARWRVVRKILVDGKGRAVASLVSGSAAVGALPDSVEILAIPASRVARVLDSGTPAQIDAHSLRLRGGTAYWTRDGRERQAAL